MQLIMMKEIHIPVIDAETGLEKRRRIDSEKAEKAFSAVPWTLDRQSRGPGSTPGRDKHTGTKPANILIS